MNTKKRKIRSDKFPLTLHPTGQYCKKIKGKVYYFGNDKQTALERYLHQAVYLYNGSIAKVRAINNNDITLKELSELYLQHQQQRVQAGEITIRHYSDQIDSLKKFVNFIGQLQRIKDISTLDLQKYKRHIAKNCHSAHRINLNLSSMKAMFHWSKKNDVLDNIPNIDSVSRGKIEYKQRYTFSPEQIQKLLEFADTQMKAIIWLGLNCGFGCTDCSELKWEDIDFDRSRVIYPRGKTGISRDLPLWPETIEALKNIPRKGELVFYTRKGRPMINTKYSYDDKGLSRCSSVNMITTKFSKLLKKAGMEVPKGTSFYALRRTAATVAARSGDPFAVQRLLGHADLKMATRYVQDVSEQTDKVVNNSREYIVQGNK